MIVVDGFTWLLLKVAAGVSLGYLIAEALRAAWRRLRG
jgi:hypothetical protein